MINKPILITGLPRSGTSLTAGCINLCGAFGGKLVPGNTQNIKGFFENMAIREPYIKEFLRKNGFCPVGVKSIPPIDYQFVEGPFRENVKEIIIKQGYKDGQWFLKDVKLKLVWTLWQQAFPEAKWVVTTRPKAAIIESCKNTSFMRTHKFTDEQWGDWHDACYEHLLNLAKNIDVQYVSTDELANGDTSQIKGVIEKLGLSYNLKVENFIDKTLWHY